MKLKLFIAVAAVIVAASCTDKEKLAQMQTSIDSLRTELNQRDTELTEYFALVSDIESNIQEIKEREQLISIDKEQNQPENQASKKQLIEDIKAINKIMAENKSKLDELNKKLQGSYYQTGKFKKMVAQLEERVSTQESEIETLNVKVSDLVARNENLNTQVDSLANINTNNSEVIAQKEAAIQDMDEQLHTAYYTSGTSQELIEKNIINKEGGFIGIGKVEQLSAQIDKAKFTSLDIREMDTFPIHSKKLELVTNHPEGSYEIILNEEERQVDKLVVLDPEKFWESSKLLVMVTK